MVKKMAGNGMWQVGYSSNDCLSTSKREEVKSKSMKEPVEWYANGGLRRSLGGLWDEI